MLPPWVRPRSSPAVSIGTPVDSSPDADDGTNTEAAAETFSYTATDANGNTVQGTITIDIVDVDNGNRFETYVLSGQEGVNRFRVVDEAITEYLLLKKEVEDADDPTIDRELMMLYAQRGRWQDLRALLAETTDTVEGIRAEIGNCLRCPLHERRTQVVHTTGNFKADLMFIGEAPGRDEDLQGEPFVGKAGQLLTDIIKAMKLTRDDVYIANVIKCRPPENRNPEPDELDACRPFIRRQVELIQPKVIVTLGRFGLQSLTEKSYGISAVRGQWLEYDGIKLMPTYHPAYLLRNPAAKKDVWADMKKVMAELGIPV